MDQPLAGKAFLVTGAARRVGAAIARRLHRLGGNILLHHRGGLAEANLLKQELNTARPGSAETARADLADVPALLGLVDAALAAFGRLDGLVNNASSFFPTPLGSITEAAWDDIVASNLKGPLFLAQAAAPALARTRGAIVNMTSVAAFDGQIGQAAYSSSKGGVVGLTLPVARDLAAVGIRVNTVAPGLIDTPIYGEGEHAEAFKAKLGQSVLFPHRLGKPAELASMVVELITNSYMNAEVVRVDGGIRMPPK